MGESKTAEPLESDFNWTFIALAWEIPNSNWEQLNVILIKRGNKKSAWKCLVSQNHCAGPATKYSRFKFRGAKKSSYEKTDRNSQCRCDQKGCWKVQHFSNAHQKRHFKQLNYWTKKFSRLTYRARKYIEKQPIISITLHKTETLPENAVLLQTNWQIVASVPRIVPKYWIALCKPKSYLEAIKHYYSPTKRKSLSENSVFLIFHPKNLFYTFASTKQVRTRCTSTGKPKAIF